MKLIFILSFLLITFNATAIEPIHIEIGQSYSGYTNAELKRRVWQLERAVAQLQEQVFQLAIQKDNRQIEKKWTCRYQSFGKTFVTTGNTKSSAIAKLLKECSEATSAIHCKDSEFKCGNE